MLTRPSVLSAACVTVVMSFGCKIYDPSLVQGNAAGCTNGSRQPPARPTSGDPPGQLPEMVIALRDIKLLQSGTDPNTGNEEWSEIGFDLDGHCTQSPDFLTACEPPTTTAAPPIDGLQGIDNVFGHFIYGSFETQYQMIFPGQHLQDFATMVGDSGQSVVIARVRGWSGDPEDSSVDVDVTQSVFGTPAKSDGTCPIVPDDITISGSTATYTSGARAGQPVDPPAWDGKDCFWARADGFAAGMIPRLEDMSAFVTNNQLVMQLPANTDIYLVGNAIGTIVRLNGGIVVADISTDPAATGNVTVAGRWSVSNLYDAAANLAVCPPATPSDPPSAIYTMFKQAVDLYADVRADPTTDNQGLRCDAISLGVTFTTVRAQFAGTATGEQPPNFCM